MHRHLRSTGLNELASDTLSETLPLRKDDIEQKLSAEVRKLKKTNRQLTALIEEMDCLMKY